MISDSLVYYWLSRAALGSHKLNEILDELSPSELWERLGDCQSLFGDKFGFLSDSRDEQLLKNELHTLAGRGIHVMTRANQAFPVRLGQREVSPPVALYYKGDISLLNTDSVAIVGTRACSRYGQDAAQRLAAGLARAGLTVVSGLATGIDAFALRAALDAGGKVVSVLPAGLDRISPVSHINLADEIAQNGVVISELPPDAEAHKFAFHARNRLLAGLTLGTLVVEAPEKSGALMTANFALEQGREVFAVPGNIGSLKSVGCNELIKNGGAKLVTCCEDIVSELGLTAVSHEAKTANVSGAEKQILDILAAEGYAHFDALCDRTGLKPYELTPLLVSLEINDLITRLPANNYACKDLIR